MESKILSVLIGIWISCMAIVIGFGFLLRSVQHTESMTKVQTCYMLNYHNPDVNATTECINDE